METKNKLHASLSDAAVAEKNPAYYAERINGIKSQTSAILQAAVNESKRSCILIGKLLEEAKCLVPHGEWGAWLQANVDYSESTANNLMRCYREFGDEQIDMISGVSDADFFSVLTQSQMVELFRLPKAERRDFVDAHRAELDSGDMSIRDLHAEIDRLNAENARLKSAPPPEPIVQEVIVNSPTPEQIDKIRAEEAAKADKRIADINKAHQMRLDAVQGEKDKAKDALEKARKAREKAEAERDERDAALKKAHADHEDQLSMMTEKYEAELEKAKASAGADPVEMAVVAARIAELEKALKVAKPSVAEFKALFDTAQGIVRKLRDKIEEIRAEDSETAEKLGKAMEMLANSMRGA